MWTSGEYCTCNQSISSCRDLLWIAAISPLTCPAIAHLLISCLLFLQIKRNLYNFSLLFASNVENLVAFMVQGYISEGLLHFIEVCLGMVYLAAVLYNLYWFLTPLADREEFDAMSRWIEKRVDYVVDIAMKPFHWLKRKAGFEKAHPTSPTPNGIAKWRLSGMAAIGGKATDGEEKSKDNGRRRVSIKKDDSFETNRKAL